MFDLTRFGEAPIKGTVFASFRDRIVFERYDNKERIYSMILEKADLLLELHMFDSTMEYRVIKRRNGIHEYVITDDVKESSDMFEESIYTEDAFKPNSPTKVSLINYIDYDDNDLLRIRDYRLKEIE